MAEKIRFLKISKQSFMKVYDQNAELKAENAELKKLIKGNEEICRQRNRELLLHKAAAKAARSGLQTDLDAYIKLLKENDNE